jgi:hypothetical protein
MSILIKKVKCLTFTSDPNLSALSVSPDGSSFSVSLDTPIVIPKSAVSCAIDVISASIWYVTPNISQALSNNNFTYIYEGLSYSITIPDGLYSLEALNGLLSKDFLRLGFDPNLIVLTGDDSTQRCILTFTKTNTQVNFTVGNSVRTVLGFNPAIIPAAIQPANYFVYGDVEAKFNTINNFYIRSSLVSDGLPINNISAGIIASIPIPPNSVGRLINYSPNIPIRLDAPELVGKSTSNFSFQLLDDSLRPAPTLGEKYSFIMHIHYSILLTNLDVPLMQGF